MIAGLLGFVFVLFIWIIAPAIIVHSKGRRWWVWLPVSIVRPVGFLMIAMFMHGVDKDGKTSVS